MKKHYSDLWNATERTVAAKRPRQNLSSSPDMILKEEEGVGWTEREILTHNFTATELMVIIGFGYNTFFFSWVEKTENLLQHQTAAILPTIA